MQAPRSRRSEETIVNDSTYAQRRHSNIPKQSGAAGREEDPSEDKDDRLRNRGEGHKHRRGPSRRILRATEDKNNQIRVKSHKTSEKRRDGEKDWKLPAEDCSHTGMIATMMRDCKLTHKQRRHNPYTKPAGTGNLLG